MEQNRENNNRGGHPGSGSASETGRQRQESGFEGMNYEQRREPYFNRGSQSMGHSRNEDQGSNADHNQDDRSQN